MKCPVCDKGETRRTTECKEISVRGEKINVLMITEVCLECGEVFEPEGYDCYADAYEKYQRNHNWHTRYSLKDLFLKSRLSAEDFCDVFNKTTFSDLLVNIREAHPPSMTEEELERYLCGCIQKPEHELLFKLIEAWLLQIEILEGRIS